jgi:hypothetical protein
VYVVVVVVVVVQVIHDFHLARFNVDVTLYFKLLLYSFIFCGLYGLQVGDSLAALSLSPNNQMVAVGGRDGISILFKFY